MLNFQCGLSTFPCWEGGWWYGQDGDGDIEFETKDNIIHIIKSLALFFWVDGYQIIRLFKKATLKEKKKRLLGKFIQFDKIDQIVSVQERSSSCEMIDILRKRLEFLL